MTRYWTYDLAMAAGRDAANRHMREHGRAQWNGDDWNEASSTFWRLLGNDRPPEPLASPPSDPR
jgi:hypothetical protein